MKKIPIIILIFCSLHSFSQKILYRENSLRFWFNVSELPASTATISLVSDTATAIRASIPSVTGKLNTSDTASMLSPYSRTTHTHTGVYQPADADLTTYASITPSANVQSLLGAADYAAMRTQLSLVPGTNVLAPNGNGSALTGLTAAQVGLDLVNNTSDATKNAASVTLTNKTISGSNNTISNIDQSSITNYAGYTINVQALTSSPTDAQTIYLGTLPKAPVTAAATSKVYIRQAGKITGAEIYCYSGTAGTNEAWSIYVRVNNTTDYLIATVSASTNERVFSNSGLSISVNSGDYIEIKSVNPTWATNPLTTIFGGYIRVN